MRVVSLHSFKTEYNLNKCHISIWVCKSLEILLPYSQELWKACKINFFLSLKFNIFFLLPVSQNCSLFHVFSSAFIWRHFHTTTTTTTTTTKFLKMSMTLRSRNHHLYHMLLLNIVEQGTEFLYYTDSHNFHIVFLRKKSVYATDFFAICFTTKSCFFSTFNSLDVN